MPLNKKYKFLREEKSPDGKIFEWCPLCDTEVELAEKFVVQKCPSCGKPILPCDMCDPDKAQCGKCPLEVKKNAFDKR